MDFAAIISSQYLASLEMLKQTITRCPESIWNSPADKTKFWHIAYHALFYTHLYLQDTEKDFTPWRLHRPEYQFLGQLPWPPHAAPKIGEPLRQRNRPGLSGFLSAAGCGKGAAPEPGG